MMSMEGKGAIGVFDSGYGGLTVLRHLQAILPEYDYLYLGDNARAPYGSHSFDIIYQYSREAVSFLFGQGCPLVIFACNTASAKALRRIQQVDLSRSTDPSRRVLGVIRPAVEYLGTLPKDTHVGLVGTKATIDSNSYGIEVQKYAPHIRLTQMATPMWVPLVEQAGAEDNPEVRYFLQQDLRNLFLLDPQVTHIQLACTHYPLLLPLIDQLLPEGVKAIEQGEIVAKALQDYLARHPEMDERLNKNGETDYFTTEDKSQFREMASLFLGNNISTEKIHKADLTRLPEQLF